MSQRKLMAVLSLAAVVALNAGESRASLSRVEGMALSVPTLSQFTDDYVNIYYYPASVVRQNNLVLAELGNNPSGLSEFTVTAPSIVTTADQSFTVIRNFPRFGAIAFQMKQSALNNLTTSSNLNNEQLDAIWGKAFSSFDFAVRVDITNSSAETSTSPGAVVLKSRGIDNLAGFDPYPFGAVTANQIVGGGIELNTFGITPAITLHMSNDNRFEGAVTYRKYSLDRSSTAAGNEHWQDDGSASYVVNGRVFMNQGDRHVWVPAAWYVNDDLGWRVDNFGGAAGVTRSAKETYRQYGVGISDNMRVNDNNLLLWGVSVAQAKHHFTRSDPAIVAGETQELTEKTTAVPVVFAAIETDATKWLKVRAGANRTLVSDRTDTVTFGPPNATTIAKTRQSAFNLSLGTGLRWNNLDVDMTLNEKFPLTGGYILSGDRSTPFTRASATYHF
jgi:hypothetical protein